MKLVNKALKAISFVILHIITGLSLYLLSLAVTSPFFNIAVCIIDKIKKPSFIEGRFLESWLIVSVPLWLVFIIYTEIKSYKRAGSKKQNKNSERQ